MAIKTLSSASERRDYRKIYDIAIGTNYDDTYFPDDKHPSKNIFGSFEDDKLVSALHLIDYNEIKVRNTFFKMGGIEGVVTQPGYRGKGHLTRLFRYLFNELNQRSQYLSAVFPIYHPLYEHLGYGLADEHVFYQFALDNIKIKKYPNRTFKQVDEISEDIKVIYSEASEHLNYIAKRFDYQWKLKDSRSDLKFVCYDKEDNPVGYCLLKFLKNHYLFKDPSNTLHLPEAFWLDKTTKHALFQDFLASFNDQRKYGSIVLPLNELLIELFIDPIIAVRTIKPSSRLRIINLKEVLSTLIYPIQDFSLVLKIHDRYCDWNDSSFVLDSKKGTVSVSNISKLPSIDLETDIASLSQLFVGSHSIHDLVEFQKAKVNQESLQLIDTLFPKQVNFFRDFF